MNGAEKQILDAVKENGKNISKIFTKMEGMNVTQRLQHKSNKSSIDEIKKSIRGFSGWKRQVHIQWYFLAAIFIGMLLT